MRMLNSTINTDRNFTTNRRRGVDLLNSPLFAIDKTNEIIQTHKDSSELGIFDSKSFHSAQKVSE